jgi:hypothetical protein
MLTDTLWALPGGLSPFGESTTGVVPNRGGLPQPRGLSPSEEFPIAVSRADRSPNPNYGVCPQSGFGSLVRTFDLAPPSGRVALGGLPGLKPWAEFCRPFGDLCRGSVPIRRVHNMGLSPIALASLNHGVCPQPGPLNLLPKV